jgi:colanic acid biosynthesis glycosyl transferase WcaI
MIKPAQRAPGDAMEPAVWVVSELYSSEKTDFFVSGIAEGLSARHAVRMLTNRPMDTKRDAEPWHAQRAGITAFHCWSTRFPKDRLALRLVNVLTLSVSMFLSAARRFRRGDRVIVVTSPPMLPFVIAVACWLRGARLMVLMHDVYPDILETLGIVSRGSVAWRALDWMNRRLLAFAARVIVLGRDMRQLAIEKLNGAQEKVVIIPNWGDTEAVRAAPASQSALRRRLQLEDKFVVQYMGNMGRTHGVENVVAASEQPGMPPGAHFLFIGSGARRPWLEQVAGSRSNLTVLPPCSDTELPDALIAGDVAVIPFRDGMLGLSVPSRMYNVLAAGRPIIAAADPRSELAQVVSEERVGWVVPPEDPVLLAAAIREAMEQPALLQEMGRRARASAELRYSRAAVIARYEALMRVEFAGG